MAQSVTALKLLVVLGMLWLSGCGISHPQTATEFRVAVADTQFATKETFEVSRPLAQVAASLQRLAADCLARTIRTTDHQPMVSYQVIVSTFKPTVRVTATGAELHVQLSHRGNVINIKEPDGGYFVLVADARPVSATKTRIDLYRPTLGHGELTQAVRSWAGGSSVACPTLIK
jgi:hypothetical protein